MDEKEHSIVIDEDECTGCGICVDFCHVDAIQINDDECVVEIVDLETCIECHSCQQNCPQKAIFVYPQLEDAMENMK